VQMISCLHSASEWFRACSRANDGAKVRRVRGLRHFQPLINGFGQGVACKCRITQSSESILACHAQYMGLGTEGVHTVSIIPAACMRRTTDARHWAGGAGCVNTVM
jgi:hypothetical protein